MDNERGPQCVGVVTWGNFGQERRCQNRGILDEDGMMWCKKHAPSEKQRRSDASVARHEQKMAALRTSLALPSENARLTEAVARLSAEKERLLTALEDVLDWSSPEEGTVLDGLVERARRVIDEVRQEEVIT